MSEQDPTKVLTNEERVFKVMELSRAALPRQYELLTRDTAGVGHHADYDRTPQAQDLDAALGTFALQHIEDLDSVYTEPLSGAVERARDAYFSMVMARKTDWAVYTTFKRTHEAEVTDLLIGTRLKVTSFGGMLSTHYGWDASGGGPAECAGSFIKYSAIGTRIYFGDSEELFYSADLWEKRYERDVSFEEQSIKQAAKIEIIG